MNWIDLGDSEPEREGWYAIHFSWDAEEGSFVGADYFDGERWRESNPVIQFAGPFADDLEASEWADKHDYITW